MPDTQPLYTTSRKNIFFRIASGMRKMFLRLMIVLLLVITASGLYLSVVAIEGCLYSLGVVMPDLEKGLWRVNNGKGYRFKLKYKDLSPKQIKILLAVYDPAFNSHRGVDFSTPGVGFTTITQHLASRLYLEDSKPVLAKIKQSVVAVFAINSLISKEDQIQLFVNSFSFGKIRGRRVVGFDRAARSLFRKPFKRLKEKEYLTLVAMMAAPSTFHPINHPKWVAERVRRIKRVINGSYQPKGLMDQFYGKLPTEVIEAGLPPYSYFEFYYDNSIKTISSKINQ